MVKFLFLVFSIQLIPLAQMVFSPIYNLSNTPSATSDYHSVYSQGNSFYAAWGDNGAVLFKYSSDYGQSWSANKMVTSTGSYPVIAAEGSNIVIVYHILNSGVFSQRSTDGGISWSSPYTMSLHSSAITPQVSLGNRLYAVWEERPGSNYELYFSVSTNFGGSWSAPVNISNTSTTSRWVQLVSNGNQVYCAWIETTTYPYSDIYFTKSTDAGVTWTVPANITNDSRPQNRIFMDLGYGPGSDILYLACDDIISYPPLFNYDDIFLIKSTDSGETWSAAVNITGNPGHSNTPCLTVIEPWVFFTWSDNSNSAPAYDNSDIFFKVSADGGQTWQDSVMLCSNPETSSRPRISWGINGPVSAPWIDLSVIWYDYSTGDAEILARNGRYEPVPVEMAHFSATADGNSVSLVWVTATETNNRGFEIERRQDAGDFETLYFVPGFGTTAESRTYAYNDRNLAPGKYTYRLKQVDYDGDNTYSTEVEALIGMSDFYLGQNFPNPFNPVTVIRYYVREAVNVELKVFDLLGKETALLVNEMQEPGMYEVKFEKGSLSSGTYFYKLKAGDYISVKKMTIMK